MPKDKTAAHEQIIKTAREEFLEKGFVGASMKAVADKVGMTSAGLYRHFDGKQAMFAALVQPALTALEDWKRVHIAASYEMLESGDTEEMWAFDSGVNDMRMVLDVMYQRPDTFRLLFFRSAGTPFEHTLHELVEAATDRMMEFLAAVRAHGVPARDLRRDEMHMLVSGYVAALLQPIEHGYEKADAERYLRTIMAFFTPGWRVVTGL